MKHQTVLYKSLICVVIMCCARVLFDIKFCLRHDSSMLMVTTTGPVGNKMWEVQEKSTSNCISPLKGKGSSKPMIFHNEQKWFNIDKCEIVSKPSILARDRHKRFECTHFMNFQFNHGRTGNQLFQVSSLLGAAMYHGYTPVIDSSFPLTEWFDLPNIVVNMTLANSRSFIRKPSVRNFHSGITELSHDYNWTLKGFMHSWRYFEGAEPAIRKALMLKQNLVKQVQDFMNHTVDGIENPTAVCVHVRRGDYLNKNVMREGNIFAPVRYLKDAMTYFREKFTNVIFFALSNDKEWLRENMNWDNVTISSFNSVGLDMALMSLCDHTIYTSGTFGWWGAWLAGGDVIYWAGYPRKGSPLDKRSCRYDLIPKEWIGMP